MHPHLHTAIFHLKRHLCVQVYKFNREVICKGYGDKANIKLKSDSENINLYHYSGIKKPTPLKFLRASPSFEVIVSSMEGANNAGSALNTKVWVYIEHATKNGEMVHFNCIMATS